MTVPGYDACDGDTYNPDCRCYPKETETMSTNKPDMRWKNARGILAGVKEPELMTAHDTTDHVAAIENATQQIIDRWQPREDGEEAQALATLVGTINEHAEQLAAAERGLQYEKGRADRLQRESDLHAGMCSDLDKQLAAAEAERDAERARGDRFEAFYRTVDSDASMIDWIVRVMEARKALKDHGERTDGSDDDAK